MWSHKQSGLHQVYNLKKVEWKLQYIATGSGHPITSSFFLKNKFDTWPSFQITFQVLIDDYFYVYVLSFISIIVVFEVSKFLNWCVFLIYECTNNIIFLIVRWLYNEHRLKHILTKNNNEYNGRRWKCTPLSLVLTIFLHCFHWNTYYILIYLMKKCSSELKRRMQ